MIRQLGRSGIGVSGLGLGCWAIGGPVRLADGTDGGFGLVDDAESLRAIRAGLDAGVTFFDTADVYGTGHSEELLGRALANDRDRVVIATKFGHTFDEGGRRVTGADVSPAYVRRALEGSLRRLRTDHVELLQLHVGDADPAGAALVADELEALVDEGLIGAYGWSTDDPDRASSWAHRERSSSLQFTLNVFQDAPALIDLCERNGLAAIARSPLAAGFLSGKYGATASRVGPDDWRAAQREWTPFFTAAGTPEPGWLRQLDAVRDILTSGGRTPAQGALAWIWARSPATVPIPGFKTVAQVTENASALAQGPLSAPQLAELERLLA